MITKMQNNNWHLKFEVPDKNNFGYSVSQSIDTGCVTSTSRRKIVSVLKVLILQHTSYPRPEQYTKVCMKLIEKFPKLKDPVGNGIVR